ncbi:MAG: sigma-70 family RNA polymerase sigma factor [Phycisphaerales bacterium]|nr:sigma-70 family RNA polymerase sigma factor [Phycisphaerales bacterium]
MGGLRDSGAGAADGPSDEALVEAANRGDETAFVELYRRHKDWAFRVALRFTRDPEEAADAVQETFVYVLRKIPNLRLSARMRTWLYPVIRSTTVRMREKRLRLQFGDERDPPAPQREGADSELDAALASLSAEQREAVLLRYVDDLSMEEIAQVQGTPVGTVKSRLHHALGRLREDARSRRYFLGDLANPEVH